MYAVAKSHGDVRRAALIERLGRQLKAATELSLEYPQGSLGHAAAWDNAEQAVRQLGELVDCTTPLEPALCMAARRVLGSAVASSDGRARRQAARRRR
jgi:hypothetical protein